MKRQQQVSLRKAKQLHQQGKTGKAIELLENLALKNPHLDELITLLVDFSIYAANRQLTNNNLEDAIGHLLTAIKYKPEHAQAHFLTGAAHAQLGNFEQAMLYTNNAITLDPNNVDARYNKAQLYMQQENEQLAIECYRQLLLINGNHAQAQGNLAILLHKYGMNEDAREHYRKAIALRPDIDAFKYGLAGIEGKAIPEEYVSKLFDDGADRFDTLLVNKLDYRTPELIRALLDKHLTGTDYSVLDLGCGTGLSGKIIMDVADRLVGVDISGGMLNKARQKGIYTELMQEEILRYLTKISDTFDIILASDVFNYIGDLSAVFSNCYVALNPGGYFVFSAESTDADGFHMDIKNLRYTHSSGYILNIAADTGLSLKDHNSVVLRNNYGGPVSGDIYLLEKA